MKETESVRDKAASNQPTVRQTGKILNFPPPPFLSSVKIMFTCILGVLSSMKNSILHTSVSQCLKYRVRPTSDCYFDARFVCAIPYMEDTDGGGYQSEDREIAERNHVES